MSVIDGIEIMGHIVYACEQQSVKSRGWGLMLSKQRLGTGQVKIVVIGLQAQSMISTKSDQYTVAMDYVIHSHTTQLIKSQ